MDVALLSIFCLMHIPFETGRCKPMPAVPIAACHTSRHNLPGDRRSQNGQEETAEHLLQSGRSSIRDR